MWSTPRRGQMGSGTIGILGNRIVEGAEAGKASVSEVDAAGCYVFPGLVDHHAHLFYGASEFCVKPETCLPFGVTAMVDPGTAGSANFDSFYQNIIVGSIPRHPRLYQREPRRAVRTGVPYPL